MGWGEVQGRGYGTQRAPPEGGVRRGALTHTHTTWKAVPIKVGAAGRRTGKGKRKPRWGLAGSWVGGMLGGVKRCPGGTGEASHGIDPGASRSGTRDHVWKVREGEILPLTKRFGPECGDRSPPGGQGRPVGRGRRQAREPWVELLHPREAGLARHGAATGRRTPGLPPACPTTFRSSSAPGTRSRVCRFRR